MVLRTGINIYTRPTSIVKQFGSRKVDGVVSAYINVKTVPSIPKGAPQQYILAVLGKRNERAGPRGRAGRRGGQRSLFVSPGHSCLVDGGKESEYSPKEESCQSLPREPTGLGADVVRHLRRPDMLHTVSGQPSCLPRGLAADWPESLPGHEAAH